MLWRDRVKQEVLAVLSGPGTELSDEATADLIADCLPSPDERNGYVIVPVTPTQDMLQPAGDLIVKIADAAEMEKKHCGDFEDADAAAAAIYKIMIDAAKAV